MPIVYICTSCEKSYSRRQQINNLLCARCGNLLLSQFKPNSKLFSYSNSANQKSPKKTSDYERLNKNEIESISIQRAAKSLINKSKIRNEYLLIKKEEITQSNINQISNDWWLFDSDHRNALKLKRDLLRKFEHKTIEQAIPGKTVSNNYGDFYFIEQKSNSIFKRIDPKKCKNILLSDLKLLSGIGNKRESNLQQSGYFSIHDLMNHPIWNSQAKDYMNLIEMNQISQLQSFMWKRLPKSHPFLHYLAGLDNPRKFAIVDIETLGLSERPIILLGIGQINENIVYTSQFLLRDIGDEPSAIWAFVSKIKQNSHLISYNGRSFDIPYVHQRLAYYGMEASLNNPHFDLLHFTRRALRRKLKNCRLETVEEYLKIGRGINIPGALVPDFYDTYLRTGNVGPLVAIVEHNKQDLVTLAALFSKLYEEWNIL